MYTGRPTQRHRRSQGAIPVRAPRVSGLDATAQARWATTLADKRLSWVPRGLIPLPAGRSERAQGPAGQAPDCTTARRERAGPGLCARPPISRGGLISARLQPRNACNQPLNDPPARPWGCNKNLTQQAPHMFCSSSSAHTSLPSPFPPLVVIARDGFCTLWIVGELARGESRRARVARPVGHPRTQEVVPRDTLPGHRRRHVRFHVARNLQRTHPNTGPAVTA